MSEDAELLHRYATDQSETAFAELIRRHVDLVYSAALRLVQGDVHRAQDITQQVFAQLARQAGRLTRHPALVGWLYTTTRQCALYALRTEQRRSAREQEATIMNELLREPAPEPDWERLRPALEDAMHELGEKDRLAVLLRFFQNKSLKEVGLALDLNENAARMRVDRALEKLRAVLLRRGVSTTTALASVISANAVQLAPANLAATLATSSIAATGTGTFTLLKIMTATPLKFGISAIAVAGLATALVVQHGQAEKLGAQNESLAQQLAQIESDNATLSNRLAGASANDAHQARQSSPAPSAELLKLRGDNDVLRQQADAEKHRADTAEQKLAAALSAHTQFASFETRTVNAAKQVGLAMRIYQSDNQQFPTNFDQITNSLGHPYSIGGVELYSFEFVNTGSLNLDYPQAAALREKIARQSPDGTWHRTYLLADGSVHIATSNDGNFDQWEKINTTQLPANRAQASGQ